VDDKLRRQNLESISKIFHSLLKIELCKRFSLEDDTPDVIAWAAIGRRLAIETAEAKALLGLSKPGRKKLGAEQSLDVKRATIMQSLQTDFPEKSAKEWLLEIKAYANENPRAKELFLSDESTLESSISRGKKKLRKNGS